MTASRRPGRGARPKLPVTTLANDAPKTPARTWTLARRVLGLRRRVRVGPAVYIERDASPLASALQSGRTKLYDVQFDHAPSVRIRVGPERLYPDLTGPQGVEPYLVLSDQIIPGLRVLDARCGSGSGAAWLASRVGHSGGVVAVDPDHEFIRFARRRYPIDHLGFELGGVETLAGELDGSFNAVVVNLHHHELSKLSLNALNEYWRVTAPSGILALLLPPGAESDPQSQTALTASKLLEALPGPYRLERHSPAHRDLAALVLRRPQGAAP